MKKATKLPKSSNDKILFSILTDITATNTTADLLKVIFKKLFRIIDFDDISLFHVLEDGRHRDLAVETDLKYTSTQMTISNNVKGWLTPHEAFDILTEKQKLYSIQKFFSEFPNHPHQQFIKKAKLKQFISSPLFKNGQTFGFFILWSKNENAYSEKHIPLFSQITDMIAVALSNILDREIILHQNKINEHLLSISEATAAVSDFRELFDIINDKVKLLFPFDDSGLFHVLPDGRHKDFMLDIANLGVISEKLKFADIGGYLEPDDSITDALRDTRIFNEQEFLENVKDHPHFEELKKSGVKQVLSTPLLIAGEPIGFFTLISCNPDTYSETDFPIFRNLADLLALALNNLIVKDELIAEKNIKETLLAISESIATIQYRKQLLKVIFDRINPIIPIEDVGIVVLNQKGTQVRDLAISDNYNNTDYNQALRKEGATGFHDIGPFTKMSLKNTGIITLKDLGIQYPNHPVVKISAKHKHSIKEFMYTPMKVGNRKIGILYFDAKLEGTYSPKMFPLFKAIADQLAVAVSNVLANEKIIEREKEKTTLLEITSAVSKIRNLPDFLSFVTKQLKPIFNFADVGIFLVTDNGDYHYDMAGSDIEISESLINKAMFADGNKKILHKDSLIEWMIEEVEKQKGPVLFDFVKLVTDFPDYYQFQLVDMTKTDYRDCLAANLKIGDSIFGMFCINALKKDFFKKEQFSLFQNITELLSVAVSNILANQQMEEEKKFSENLLEITEALAAAEDAVQLYQAIDTVVKKIIPFDQVGVLILDKTEAYHYEMINEVFVNQISDKDNANTTLEKQILYTHKGSSVAWLANNGPVITTMDFLVKNTEHPRHIDMVNAGVKELLGGPLTSQGKSLGMLAFKLKEEGVFNEQHIKHYKSVAEQVAICVANILSKKEILWKSSVQDLELRLSNILTDDNHTQDKWESIFKEFKKRIPFTFAVVMKIDNGKIKRYIYDWLSPKENRQLSIEDLEEITKLSTQDIKKVERELYHISHHKVKFYDAPGVLPKTVNVFMNALGLNSLLTQNINIKKKDTEIVYLMFSKHPKQYSIRHSNILKGVKNTLRISLENMFSSFAIKEMSEQLQLEKTYLESVVKEAYNFEHMIGESEAIREVFNQIAEVASVDATTLLLGETGTGKELIARAIHENSDRKDHILVKVNCAAIPSQIVESELFGHKRGAFTGAVQDRIGKFELANKGTIFLDEIGEMPLELQTKLLRVLQEREVERLGSNEVIKLDIRIIAATNKDLLKEIENGKFRSDLYYRLNGFPIQVPPLRVRDEDILLLSDFFARQFSERYGLPFKGFTANSLSRLKRYDWPGNVRELQNLMEQAIISQRGKVLEVYPGSKGAANLRWSDRIKNTYSSRAIPDTFDMETIKQEKDTLERAYILQALEKTNWRVSGKNGAARLLDVAPTTLESKMKRLGIERNTI